MTVLCHQVLPSKMQLWLALFERPLSQHLNYVSFSQNKDLALPENLSLFSFPFLIYDHMYFLDSINYVRARLMNTDRTFGRVVNYYIWLLSPKSLLIA